MMAKSVYDSVLEDDGSDDVVHVSSLFGPID